jgi:hypothetical protein
MNITSKPRARQILQTPDLAVDPGRRKSGAGGAKVANGGMCAIFACNCGRDRQYMWNFVMLGLNFQDPPSKGLNEPMQNKQGKSSDLKVSEQ